MKELYEKGKGAFARVRKYVRSPEVPKPKAKPEARGEIGRLQGVHRRQGVRGSGELRGTDSGRGIRPYGRESATAFFSLVSARYERGSIILTSNKGFADWREPLGGTVIATTTLDKLPHHSHVLNICRESYRLKDKHQAGLLTSHRLLTSTARVGQIQLGENARRPTAH